MFKLLVGKNPMSRKRTEKKDSQKYSNSRSPQKRTFLLACAKFSENNREGSFRFVIALMNGSVHAQQMKKQQINRQ